VGEDFQDEDKMGVSSFGKINHKSIGQVISAKNTGFLIGPVFDQNEAGPYAEIFAPKVFIKGENGKLQAYRMLVYQGHRCLVTLLFKIEGDSQYPFNYALLSSLTNFLNMHVPPVSAQLEGVVSKVLAKAHEHHLRLWTCWR
jgi:hypothetical protein